ncbi:MAG: hypothetical protein HY348_16210 [Nitrospira defluvii]|nr:hypothetical protein [Nitrospira defluvii]
MMWVQVLLLSLVALLLPKSAEAKVYRCEGAGGTTILTDQPKGKRGCVVVATTSPSPPGGHTPPADPVPPAQLDLPPTAMPPSASPMLPRPPMSAEQAPSSAASAEPPTPAAPEAQHCSPSVNPLNPFAGLNCPPASGNKPGETKQP